MMRIIPHHTTNHVQGTQNFIQRYTGLRINGNDISEQMSLATPATELKMTAICADRVTGDDCAANIKNAPTMPDIAQVLDITWLKNPNQESLYKCIN